jgi:hypothetical protein
MDAIRNDLARRIVSVALILAFAVLVLARIPAIELHGGRFWAEEGTVYFGSAWHRPWYVSWFTVAADAGYWNFAAGFGTWLALKFGGLLHAPQMTIGVALLIQCVPVYVIVTHEFPWRRSVAGTVVAVLFCAIPPVTGEVWLNTITSQFQLALAAALIFAAPARRRWLEVFDCLVLGVAAVSGPATSFLMPLFVTAAVLERRSIVMIEAAIVFVGFCCQLTVYLLYPLAERGAHMGVAALLSVISLHVIVLQTVGLDLARDFAVYLRAVRAGHGMLWAGPLIFASFYGLIGWGILRARNWVLLRLYAACLVFVLVSFGEAWSGSFVAFMHVVDSQRYGFAPEVLDSLMVLGLALTARGGFRVVFLLGTAMMLVVGVVDFRSDLLLFGEGPSWPRQVALWRADPQHFLLIWPGKPWAVNLRPGPWSIAHPNRLR